MQLLPARLYPFLNKVLRHVRAPVPLEQMAYRVEEIAPAETSYMPPIIMFEDDWDLVEVVPEATIEEERARVAGRMCRHDATIRYEFRDVLATRLGAYVPGRSFNSHGNLPATQLLRDPIVFHDRGCFGLPLIGMMYFGHWVHDGLPSSLLCAADETLYLPTNPDWPHTAAYLDQLGWACLSDPVVHFQQMSLHHDIGFNANRRARIRQMHGIMQDCLPQDLAAQRSPGVFICRGSTGSSRALVNEAQIAERLAARGFRICHATDDLDMLLRACAGAQVVVTMEGSQWAHAFFAAPLGALFVMPNPSDRFKNNIADYLPALNQRMATMVVTRAEGGYHANPDKLERLIDMALAELDREYPA
jgi:hypothetical protein